MQTENYTTVRNNLSRVMDKINDEQISITIMRQKAPAMVMMSIENYNRLTGAGITEQDLFSFT